MSRSNNSLYQWLEKKDLDPTNKLTDDEWAEFIKLHEDSFAEEGTKLGISFLRIWISNGHLEKYRESSINNDHKENRLHNGPGGSVSNASSATSDLEALIASDHRDKKSKKGRLQNAGPKRP